MHVVIGWSIRRHRHDVDFSVRPSSVPEPNRSNEIMPGRRADDVVSIYGKAFCENRPGPRVDVEAVACEKWSPEQHFQGSGASLCRGAGRRADYVVSIYGKAFCENRPGPRVDVGAAGHEKWSPAPSAAQQRRCREERGGANERKRLFMHVVIFFFFFFLKKRLFYVAGLRHMGRLQKFTRSRFHTIHMLQ